MNDSEIEAIVREYCEIMRVDPDARELIDCPDNKPGCCVAHFGPARKNYVQRAKEMLAWKKVLRL